MDGRAKPGHDDTGTAVLPPLPLRREHLPRIEQLSRIERRLDPAHEVKGGGAPLILHIGDLLLADSVFAGARAAHRDGAVGEAGGKGVSRLDLLWAPTSISPVT